RDAEATFRATNSGPFTVVAAAYFLGGTGNYTLNLAKAPGTITLAPGDEGGPLTNGVKHTGVIEVGDLDMWSFNATAGDSIVLRSGADSFTPFIRLYGPDGAPLATSTAAPGSGVRDAEAVFRMTNSGPC